MEATHLNKREVALVTGGAGSIGSNLVKALLSRDIPVVVIDDLSSGHLENIPVEKNIQFIRGDICNDENLEKAFSKNIITVYHLAANFANQSSIDNPEKDLMTNGLGILKVLEYSARHGVKRFIYASSSCVYAPCNEPIVEDSPLELKTPYAITKLLGEHYVNFFAKYHGLNAVILRYFNSYGPGEFPGKYRNVIPNFFERAINNKPLIITGTGDETRAFTYVDDIVHGTLLAGENKNISSGEIFNIGSTDEIKIIDLAKKIHNLTNNKGGIKFQERRKWDNVVRRVPSIKKAINLLGYRFTVPLDEGLEKTYSWLLKNLRIKELKKE